MLEGYTVEILHHNEGFACVLTDVLDGANVGVVQSRGSPGLTAESFECLAVVCQIIGQKFQNHKPVEASVFGLVDDTHAPTTESFEDAIVDDDFPG